MALPWDFSAAEDITCQDGGRSSPYPAHLPVQKYSELGCSSFNKLIPESPCLTQHAAYRQSVLGLHFQAVRSDVGLLSKILCSGSQLTQEVWEQLCGICSFVTQHFKQSLVTESSLLRGSQRATVSAEVVSSKHRRGQEGKKQSLCSFAAGLTLKTSRSSCPSRKRVDSATWLLLERSLGFKTVGAHKME